MFRITATLTTFLILLGAVRTQAQKVQKEVPEFNNCTYNFSAGTGIKSVSYCVSSEGNILSISMPSAEGMVFGREGYGVCNESPALAYYDYALSGDSANWGPATTLSHTTASVKIARTTGDGIWTLTQTITVDKATPGIKITMALKNNTAVGRTVYLVRYADVDAADYLHNNFDGTANSASGWSSTTGVNDGVGLTLRNTGTRWAYTNGFVQNIFGPPNPCAFAFNWPGHIVTNTDGSILLAYVESIGAGKTKTATLSYRGM